MSAVAASDRTRAVIREAVIDLSYGMMKLTIDAFSAAVSPVSTSGSESAARLDA
jgi:hypothetical protein